MSQHADIHLIKKYANRRLYDMDISCYITLEDVRTLVTEGETFKVIDAKTHQDLTRNVLLQLVTEQENGPQPMLLSDASLRHIICNQTHPMQPHVREHFEQSISALLAHISQLHTLPDFQKFAEQYDSLWQTIQKKHTLKTEKNKLLSAK